MFNRKGEIMRSGRATPYGTRERKTNGTIVIVVLSFLAWAVLGGVLTVRLVGAAFQHQHTAECWDD